MDFHKFKTAVAKSFKEMSTSQLFCTTVDKDVLWNTYLSSFPSGADPIFRERTVHSCACCRQFIRTLGNVVAIIDGELVSIWDTGNDLAGEPEYQIVADKMSALVSSVPIDNLFLHTEKTVGTDKSFEQLVEGVKTWEHFFAHIPHGKTNTDRKFVCTEIQIGPRQSEARSTHDVFLRSLKEITPDSIETVLELIAQNSIYRGAEHKFAVDSFKAVKIEFDKLVDNLWALPLRSKHNKAKLARLQDVFAWDRFASVPVSVSKIRSTAIGTLLTDLSEGKPLEAAVGAFEFKVAPQNYKRTTALVTPAMINKARKEVESLGLTSALERRYAKLPDVSAANVLFADRSAKKRMANNVFDDLKEGIAGTQVNTKSLDKVEAITIEKFLKDVLPKATSLDLLVENRHTSNLVSLIAPVDPTANKLFKWDNLFSWDYNGGYADAIKERVKQAGGNVTGDLCCRLSWSNYDDLDLHMLEYDDNHRIWFRNKGQPSPSGGMLDVDMNAGSGTTREPVENIYYAKAANMRQGRYELVVNNFHTRESKDVGFEVQIDFKGTVYNFAYPKVLREKEFVTVADMRYTHAGGLEIISSLPMSTTSKKVWNINTGVYHKVNVMMLSPNYWDGQGTGNQHYFFMLNECRNDGQARGFFNENLNSKLDPHRKVLEMVGAKMQTEESDDQLSGLGFSSTVRNHVFIRVNGAFSRVLKVTF